MRETSSSTGDLPLSLAVSIIDDIMMVLMVVVVVVVVILTVIMRMVMADCHPHQLRPLLAVSLSHFFPGVLYLDNSSNTDCMCVCDIEIKSIS